MIKFCKNCSGELANADDKICAKCGTNAVKGNTYCRHCGKPTKVEDSTCLFCGASLKPLPSTVRSLFEYPRLSAKMGKVINLSIVVVVVTLYVAFTLPKAITRPLTQTASDAVMASTGFTTLPLSHIEATPPLIPELVVYYFTYTPPGIAVNSTRQITVYAIYKNTDTENGTKAIRAVDITDNCTYRSTNETIAIVTSPGLVLAKKAGSANITAFYTTAPGTANISNASAGKVPVTFNTSVTVFVR